MSIAALASLAGALKPSGSTKATSTSNVASNITATIANVIGEGASTGGVSSGGATASPSFTEATSGQLPFFAGSAPDSFDSSNALETTGGGFSFGDPVVIAVMGLLAVGAFYALK